MLLGAKIYIEKIVRSWAYYVILLSHVLPGGEKGWDPSKTMTGRGRAHSGVGVAYIQPEANKPSAQSVVNVLMRLI